ncbi:glycosylhydrolase-like jelly roll fold domain-containing protein [Paludibaculum fermentans]|uniref:Glycosyl hydrolases family 2 sugar binding domain-containing protein n=1 Tax=Paludibaculum fermentans TaxID=1473598 RepID=A0A7S7SN42_PALFE|nr:glycosylhydrolase-like jelly roll fold domain-containing protein [Paludibaculum fermentans]QOY90156.1 hypothetical protein IRI77_09445 [Paludibaculum fermentans]
MGASSPSFTGSKTDAPPCHCSSTPVFTVPARPETTLVTLDGAWELRCAPNPGAPGTTTLDHLASWSDNADPGVKYFSGTAAYQKSFEAPAGSLTKGRQLTLDLGDVRELAETSVNGHPLGIVWRPPYRVDITGAVKPGPNTFEIKVTNLWVNHLIGDQQPGAARISFTVPPTYKPDAPLPPSGLLGPVVIQQSVAGKP